MSGKSDDVLRTWDALAGAVGVPLRRIHEDRAKPGAPKNKSVKAWREFIATFRDLSASSEERIKLRMDIQREELRKRQISNEGQETRLKALAQSAAEEVIDRMMARIRAVLLGQLPGQIADAVTNQSRNEREAIIRRTIEGGLQNARA